MVARLDEIYKTKIAPAMREKFNYSSPMAIPKITKIVISQGLGKSMTEKKRMDEATADLAAIAGQKPVITRARKSVSNFKLRAGMLVGTKVTLRRERMYEFLDKLISIAVPRLKDFRGFSPKAFDGSGNYSLGIAEQRLFPEINPDKVAFVQGMNITIATTAKTDEEAWELLKLFGIPFKREEAPKGVAIPKK